jgi:hypothetical protein
MSRESLKEAIADHGVNEALRAIIQIVSERLGKPFIHPYAEPKFVERIEESIDLYTKFPSEYLKEFR